MKKVKIAYGKLKASDLVTLANNVHTKLTLNTTFPTPPVTLVNLLAQMTVLKDAITAAANRDREMLAQVRSEKKTLAGMLRQVAEYVNTTVTDGDEAKLLSSGFELYKTPESGLPGPIDRIDALYTNIAGTIDLLWKRSRLARYYNVFVSANNGATWTLLNTVFGRRLLITSLVSGTRYLLKVVPVGVEGEGPVSDIASQVAS